MAQMSIDAAVDAAFVLTAPEWRTAVKSAHVYSKTIKRRARVYLYECAGLNEAQIAALEDVKCSDVRALSASTRGSLAFQPTFRNAIIRAAALCGISVDGVDEPACANCTYFDPGLVPHDGSTAVGTCIRFPTSVKKDPRDLCGEHPHFRTRNV